MSPHIVGSPDPERFRVPVASAFLVEELPDLEKKTALENKNLKKI